MWACGFLRMHLFVSREVHINPGKKVANISYNFTLTLYFIVNFYWIVLYADYGIAFQPTVIVFATRAELI